MQLNPELVRRSLDSHSSIGLVVGVLMYLICLTGTLVTLAEAFERWEQPGIAEFSEVDPAAIETAMAQFRSEVNEEPESLWVVFPTPELPRMHVTSGDEERFTDAGGNLLAAPIEGWTHMLRELHISLHLPHNIGLILVSATGAMLVALILSGLLSHPRLFRDAFKLRLGGSRRLEQADIHNRLSVWALPFHLMIAVTGAFYGLVGLLVFSAATAWYQGDTQTLFDAVYGADPVVEAAVQPLNTSRAMAQLAEHHPAVSPLYIVAHQTGTTSQFMEIAATVPGRLTYSEIYRFEANGTYIGSQGLTSGPVGRQFLYSLYRIHFGYFGGQITRVIWLLLGLTLTVVSVTGVNIWLTRRGRDNWVDRAWTGAVWGTPLGLTISAIGSVFAGLPALPLFLAILSVAVLSSCGHGGTHEARRTLLSLCSLSLIVLALAHLVTFPPSEYGSYLAWINGGITVTAITLGITAWRSRQRPS